MEIIRHRQNRLAELSALPPALGAEIDIRSRDGRLILAHDPFASGDDCEEYLSRYGQSHASRLLIVNTKEDGHEALLREMLAKAGIERYFFLDTAIPTLAALAVKGKERRAAVRVSEFEPVELAARFQGSVEWVWLDCFDGTPAPRATIERLKPIFKICAVSPELQGYPQDRIAAFRPLMPLFDAVCTKYPERWA